MRFASLGSGSRGNATLVEHGTTCLLIDCGFSVQELRRRLARVHREGSQLSAIVVTHEHGDHIRGVAACARQFGLPVWLTPGTLHAVADQAMGSLSGLNLFSCHEPFAIGDIEVRPFPVPHDAREPSQFVLSDGDRCLGVLTDTGCATRHIEASLTGCHALILECNHDRDMLRNGAYPPALKQRVGGPLGHLDNESAAALLARLDTSRLQHLVAAHLSEKNNTPYLARTSLGGAVGCADSWVQVADQDHGLPWREIT
ncbi:MAG: MBL fold metallo-hydrolase [Acidiferrobacterales bacterium]